MGAQEGPRGTMEDLESKGVGWQPGISPTTIACPQKAVNKTQEASVNRTQVLEDTAIPS